MRDDKLHCFKINASGKLIIQTNDATFAGDIIQSLAMYLGVRELNSEAMFPAEEKRMLDALERVKGTSLGKKGIEYEMVSIDPIDSDRFFFERKSFFERGLLL